MKYFTTILVFTAVVCAALAGPSEPEPHALLLRQRRSVDFLSNSRKLIEQLVQNLQAAGQQGLEAINVFTAGLKDQVLKCRDKMVADVGRLRDRVSEAIQSVTDRFTNSGAAVRDCIESHRNDADNLLKDIMDQTMGCADDKVAEISEQIEHLRNISNSAIEFANHALAEMKNCSEQNQRSILSAGACLGTVAVRTEIRGAGFLTQTAVAVGRINLALTTLPASLEVCAGTRLVEAGIGTAKIVMNIGSCSASSIYTSLTGNSV